MYGADKTLYEQTFGNMPVESALARVFRSVDLWSRGFGETAYIASIQFPRAYPETIKRGEKLAEDYHAEARRLLRTDGTDGDYYWALKAISEKTGQDFSWIEKLKGLVDSNWLDIGRNRIPSKHLNMVIDYVRRKRVFLPKTKADKSPVKLRQLELSLC